MADRDPHPHARPERIGHRGAPREFDENTIEGFVRAVERGADAVELDVHRTRDGAVVVHHDPDVRLPNGSRAAIAELMLAEVTACRLARGGSVPTLNAVFDAIGGRATIYVELKGAGTGEPSAEIARGYGHRCAFHSFDHDAVLQLRARHPELAYGMLLDRGTRQATAAVSRIPVRDLWPHWSLVDAEFMAAARAAEKRVIVWTVNDADLAERLTALGVDGLCTDDVRILDRPPA
ncbi:MAG TPA: glycerophosphodiester phosphodiesterase [Gemmatimonadaceae bacterium]|nr:glycerophosphodiester phosphodiesterase [Gemmatimonadaceae bacterium]